MLVDDADLICCQIIDVIPSGETWMRLHASLNPFTEEVTNVITVRKAMDQFGCLLIDYQRRQFDGFGCHMYIYLANFMIGNPLGVLETAFQDLPVLPLRLICLRLA